MSNYHILKSAENLSYVHAIFHIAVPNENNAVEINLRTALNYSLGERTIYSIVPDLENDFPLEYAEIITAGIYEHSIQYKFTNAHLTLIQKRQELDTKYTEFATIIVNYLRKTLKYYRLDRDV